MVDPYQPFLSTAGPKGSVFRRHVIVAVIIGLVVAAFTSRALTWRHIWPLDAAVTRA
jgi:hypothetical protein